MLTIADVIVWEQQYGLVPFAVWCCFHGLASGKTRCFLTRILRKDAFSRLRSDTTNGHESSGCCVEKLNFYERQIAGVGIDTHVWTLVKIKLLPPTVWY